MNPSTVVGEKQETICSASVNSGLFTSLVEAGDVKVTFVGHDHVNDYCGSLLGIQLCYGGGIGYHTYGYVNVILLLSHMLSLCTTFLNVLYVIAVSCLLGLVALLFECFLLPTLASWNLDPLSALCFC